MTSFRINAAISATAESFKEILLGLTGGKH